MVTGNSYLILTFLELFEVLILSNYGLELVFYDCFVLLEVFGTIWMEEIEVLMVF
jgi:hypothetical protein